MSKPKISVVIPALNEEKYLPTCLESLKRQTFHDFELIVSDGGSNDKTVKIAQKYGAKTVIVPNSNVCLARDVGLRKAKGEIIVGADADTFYPKNHLQAVLEEFQKNSQVVAVTGKAKMVDGPLWSNILWKAAYMLMEIIYNLTGFITYAPALNLSYKKNVLLSLGGYNTKLDFGGDELDVLARLKKKGKVVFSSRLGPVTSGRRYRVGLFTFFFKHMLYYYWLNYIIGKITGKALTRAKPVR